MKRLKWGEREPADEEDRDHGDKQPAGPVIASISLSWSVSPATSSSSGCPPATQFRLIKL